jgi:hypothetical protein
MVGDMKMNREAIQNLRQRVLAEEGLRRSDFITVAPFENYDTAVDFGVLADQTYQGDMNAAYSLRKMVLPGWSMQVWSFLDDDADVTLKRAGDGYAVGATASGDKPCIAILAAILFAMTTNGWTYEE